MEFNHLFITPQWLREYHTKYPHGHSVLENIIEWVTLVNELIDWVNITPDKAREILTEWKNDGTLETLINEVLFESKEDLSRAKERGINIKLFGAKGDGLTNDYAAFILANEAAKLINSRVFFPPGEYIITGVNSDRIASMEGHNATLKFTGDIALLYDRSIVLKNLNIVTDHEISTSLSIGSLIQADTTGVDNFSIENVRYTCNVTNLDGSVRGKTLARIMARKVNVSNLETENASSGIIIQSTAAGDTEHVVVRDVKVKNAKTGVWVKGSYLTAIDTKMKNVTMENISLINTAAQQAKSNAVNGSDALLIERVQNLTVNNVYCERARERAIYANQIWDGKISNVTFKDTEGIKVCGYIDLTQAIEEYTENITVTNTQMIGGYDRRAFILYNIKKVTIDGVHIQNTFSNAASHIFELNLQIKDLTITNITGKNARRGMVVFNSVKVPEGSHYYKNIVIRNVKFDNPCQMNYSAIRHYIDPLITDDYLYYNIVLDNIDMDSAIINGVDSDQRWQKLNNNSNLVAICDLDRVNYLTAYNIHGNSLRNTAGFIIGANTLNVSVPESV